MLCQCSQFKNAQELIKVAAAIKEWHQRNDLSPAKLDHPAKLNHITSHTKALVLPMLLLQDTMILLSRLARFSIIADCCLSCANCVTNKIYTCLKGQVGY